MSVCPPPLPFSTRTRNFLLTLHVTPSIVLGAGQVPTCDSSFARRDSSPHVLPAPSRWCLLITCRPNHRRSPPPTTIPMPTTKKKLRAPAPFSARRLLSTHPAMPPHKRRSICLK